MKQLELNFGTEQLKCLAKILGMNVMVGKEFVQSTFERGNLIT